MPSIVELAVKFTRDKLELKKKNRHNSLVVYNCTTATKLYVLYLCLISI